MKRRSQQDISSLMLFLDHVKSYTGDDLIFGPSAGQTINHYTDLAGLKGIIDNHDLWLTHSRYSNDDEEVTHGFEIVKEVIDENKNTAADDVKKDFLIKLSDLVKEPAPEGIYICCFCLNDNLLSQWRGYGANGTGVCIRFMPQGFSYITGIDSPQKGLMRIWKVFYDRELQKNIVREAINFAYMDPALLLEEKLKRAADAIHFFIPTFKNAGFSEENECRLIFTPPPDFKVLPQVRVARGMLVPYYSLRKLSEDAEPNALAIKKLPVLSVQIGPSSNKKLNMESAKILLSAANYDDVAVDSSSTPYRG
jgi:hypothetical protein